jgi:hypothetical protein
VMMVGKQTLLSTRFLNSRIESDESVIAALCTCSHDMASSQRGHIALAISLLGRQAGCGCWVQQYSAPCTQTI